MQTSEGDPKIVTLVTSARAGNAEAVNELMPLVYDELRRLAAAYLRNERRAHSLQPTALVNVAYLCLVGQTNLKWQDRAHFLGLAARTMRRVLVDHARRHHAAKRGGELKRVTLIGLIAGEQARDVDLVALDEALSRLSAVDEPKGRMVELRFFGGLTVEETAEVMGISPATVKRMWAFAKAWLYRELQENP